MGYTKNKTADSTFISILSILNSYTADQQKDRWKIQLSVQFLQFSSFVPSMWEYQLQKLGMDSFLKNVFIISSGNENGRQKSQVKLLIILFQGDS